MGLESILFYYFAIVIVATAALAVSRRNPVYAVLFLLPCLVHIAGLWLFLGAEFLAAIQIIIYTGAIMVLYLFVIFILDLGSFRTKRIIHQQKSLAIAGGLALIVQLVVLTIASTFPGPFGPPQEVVSGGNTQAVGGVLYTDFLFPFELASLVLLVAIFGAVVLARKESEETSS